VDSVFEVKQALSSDLTLYGHIEHTSGPSAALLTVAQRIAKAMATEDPERAPLYPPGSSNLHAANADTPGLPPSSAQSFVAKSADIPALVLSNHAGRYVTSLYDSIFDDSLAGRKDRGFNQLCAHASLFARIIYARAAGLETEIGTDDTVPFPEEIRKKLRDITADCELVADLMYCLAQNPGCDRLRTLISSGYGEKTFLEAPPYYYTSVYYPAPSGYVGGMPRLIRAWLSSLARNATIQDGMSEEDASFIGRWAEFHDAIDPAIVFSYEKNIFEVPDGKDAKGYLWTESNWDAKVGVSLFREEDPTTVQAVWITGIVVAVASFLIVFASSLWCHRKFKTI